MPSEKGDEFCEGNDRVVRRRGQFSLDYLSKYKACTYQVIHRSNDFCCEYQTWRHSHWYVFKANPCLILLKPYVVQASCDIR